MSNLQKHLLEDVVIFENKEAQKTGAQSLAPAGAPPLVCARSCCCGGGRRRFTPSWPAPG